MLLRWAALLAAVIVVSKAARRFKRSPESGEIIAEEILEGTVDEKDLKLQFVNALWRHGDRSPTKAFPGDKLTEADWTFGGGGYGQLSPTGMQQHFQLGQKLRNRYINTTNPLLSHQYTSKEIYVRATDVNRTIISAMSNMLGMFSQADNANRNGTDYPDAVGWLANFVPIAVHTVDFDTDWVAGADFPCKREDELYALIAKSDEFLRYANSVQVKGTLEALSKAVNQTIDMWNLWEIADGLFIENIYHADKMNQMYPWYNKLIAMITTINNKADEFQNGLLSAQYNGLDLGNEVKKIRGGSLINDINNRLKHKASCITEGAKCNSAFFRDLKYYVISAHDTTIAALFAVLNSTDFILTQGGYPHYSAALLTELHQHTNGSFYVRFLYHGDAANDFDVVTQLIAGPGNGDFVPLSFLQAFADKYYPGEDVGKLCNTSPGKEAQTTPTPVVTTKATAPSATTKHADNPPTDPPGIDSTTTTDASSGTVIGSALAAVLALVMFH